MGDGLLIHSLIKVSLMITDQFAIELDAGESFVIKAPTSESLLGYTEVFCSLGFCKEYRGREGIHLWLHIQVE